MVLAWESLRRFLWCWSSSCCCCYSSFVNVLHSYFLFDIIPHPSVDYRQVFRPILYFQPSPSQSNSRHLHFSTIPLSSYREPYDFEWAFFTHRRFLPYAPSQNFWHNLLLSRFHWKLAVTFLKVAGLHTDPWNTDPGHLFVSFMVIHSLLCILTFIYAYQYCKSFTCGENLDKTISHTILQPWKYKAAAKLISNHKF